MSKQTLFFLKKPWRMQLLHGSNHFLSIGVRLIRLGHYIVFLQKISGQHPIDSFEPVKHLLTRVLSFSVHLWAQPQSISRPFVHLWLPTTSHWSSIVLSLVDSYLRYSFERAVCRVEIVGGSFRSFTNLVGLSLMVRCPQKPLSCLIPARCRWKLGLAERLMISSFNELVLECSCQC